jgi:hypothetical protein
VWMAVAISTNYEQVPVTDYMKSYLAAAVCGVWLKLIAWLSVINWQVTNLVNLLYEVSDGRAHCLTVSAVVGDIQL